MANYRYQRQTEKKLGKCCLRTEFARLNPGATKEMLEFEENRFARASAILCVISKPVTHAKIPKWEMQLSAGAVCQNLLTASLALGYGLNGSHIGILIMI